MSRKDRLPPSECPFCGELLDAATPTENKNWRPEPGDISMCINCTSFLQFDEDLHLVGLTAAEFAGLPKDQRDYLHRMRQVAHEMVKGGSAA